MAPKVAKPPKDKKKIKATAEAKAFTKSTAKKESAQKRSQAVLDADVDVIDADKDMTKRRLDRRDTEDQIDRIVQRKLLPKFPKEIISGAVAADGSTPRGMIADEIRRTRTKGEHLKQEFWARFFVKHPLHRGVIALLPMPPDDQEVRHGVTEAIAPLKNKNPVCRQADHISQYLSLATDLNEAEIYAIVVAAQESTTVTSAMNIKTMLGIMRYAQRNSYLNKGINKINLFV